MDDLSIQLRRGELAAAAALPQLASGDGLGRGELRLRLRSHGMWAVYRDGDYEKSTGTRDATEAREFLRLYALQEEARSDGLHDARYAPATEICDYHAAVGSATCGPVRARNIRARVGRLRPHVVGLRVWQIDGARIACIMAAMKAGGLSPVTVEASIQELRTAIRRWCRDRVCPLVMPFDAPRRSPGRSRIFTAAEQQVCLRWAEGEEDYDP